MDAIFLYTESGNIYSRTIELLSFRGMDEPDQLRKIGVIHDLLDGGISEQVRGFNKIITAQVRAITTALDRRFMAAWIVSETKVLRYGNYISSVVSGKDLESQWLEDCEYGREFTLELIDLNLYTEWSDGVLSDETMYIKLKVEMSQDATETSPEVLTTNVGKLVVMENDDAFPPFNSTTHDHYISVLTSDGAAAVYPVAYTVVANNIAISTFPMSGYVPATDGKLYANIGIHAVEK